MFRTTLALVAMGGLAASMLVACSSTTGGAGGGNSGPVVLRFATADSGPGAKELQSVVDRYNKSQGHVFIKMEAYGDAFDQKLSSQIGSGGVPDILKIWNFPM